MSIYSGFATRQQQQTYDHCLNSLLYVLQKRILKFYTNQKTDQYKFASLVQKMYLQMRSMERSKYLDPKCSYAIQQLFQFVIKQNHTQQNATVQQTSNADDSLKNQVYKKKLLQEKSFEFSHHNDPYNKQRTYQIPIRSQKVSPARKIIISNSNSAAKNIGKIVSSKSKQKHQINQTMTIQHGKHMLRQRTPSTNHGSRLIQNKIIPHTKYQQIENRNRNLSLNDGELISNKKFSKSSARMAASRETIQQHKPQHQIHDIIQGYVQKKQRIFSSKNHHKRKFEHDNSNEGNQRKLQTKNDEIFSHTNQIDQNTQTMNEMQNLNLNQFSSIKPTTLQKEQKPSSQTHEPASKNQSTIRSAPPVPSSSSNIKINRIANFNTVSRQKNFIIN